MHQNISAFFDSGQGCTAPDGTAGEAFTLEFATGTTSYPAHGDQFWSYSFTGTTCVSLTTGVSAGTNSFTVFGGTGRFRGATGTINNTYTGSYLYFAQSGQTGYFGQLSGSSTGTIAP